jgi:hypothetical protein
MKINALAVCLALTMALVVSRAQAASIQIDSIQADKKIMGHVTGLRTNSGYKVLVYVHTDRWYVHPYAGQGQGMSWATIDDDGAWSLRTVQREFKADKVAALVVKMGADEPAKVENVDSIPHEGIVVKDLSGTGDYGKL